MYHGTCCAACGQTRLWEQLVKQAPVTCYLWLVRRTGDTANVEGLRDDVFIKDYLGLPFLGQVGGFMAYFACQCVKFGTFYVVYCGNCKLPIYLY